MLTILEEAREAGMGELSEGIGAVKEPGIAGGAGVKPARKEPAVSGPDMENSEHAGFLQGFLSELPFWARELIRKTLHIGVVVLALPLRWFGYWYAILFAAAALVWNAYGMPRWFKFTFREDERQSGYSKGMLSYPVMVFILAVFFPLPIAASQWATLSFGDGFATLAGRFLGKKTLPWSREKTWVGLLAFLVMGSAGATFFFWFTLPNAGASSFLWQGASLLSALQGMSFGEIVVICALSTLVASVFESIPFKRIDDNVAAPLAGAVSKLFLCLLI